MDSYKTIRFRNNIDVAIQTIIELERAASSEDILAKLSVYMRREDAIEIFVFLPIAFCRLLLPNIEWLDEYYEDIRDGNGQQLRKFSESKSYTSVSESVSRYLLSKPPSEDIFKIAGRSSEFDVINDLLNKGGKLEDIRLTHMCIVW